MKIKSVNFVSPVTIPGVISSLNSIDLKNPKFRSRTVSMEVDPKLHMLRVLIDGELVGIPLSNVSSMVSLVEA
jgi:hypothetical protein